jgi:hypothetical protein
MLRVEESSSAYLEVFYTLVLSWFFEVAPLSVKSLPLLYRIESFLLADNSRYVYGTLLYSFSNKVIDYSVTPDAR